MKGECTVVNTVSEKASLEKNTFEQRPGGDGGYRGTWERASQVEGRGCLAGAKSRTEPICQERRPKVESSRR